MMHGLVLLLGMAFISCSQETDLTPEDQTAHVRLNLNLDANADFGASTRAVTESEYRKVDNYDVVVLDKNGIEKLNCKAYEVESRMPITLPIGAYTVKAYYGNERAASRNEFYVYGEEQGSIKADGTHAVELICTPTCGRIAVTFENGMSDYFSDYKVFFKGTEALAGDSISWLRDDAEPWYVKLNEGGETVKFAIHAKTKDGFANAANGMQEYIKTGQFTLNRNKAYKMNVTYTHTPTGEGGLKVVITIDERTNDKEVEIEVPVTWL